LKELHRLRRHTKELQTQIDRGPVVLKAQQTKAARSEEALREAQEALKKLKVSIHEKEVSLKVKGQQIEKHLLQMNAASSKKEYDALKSEIAHDRDACKQIEDEILTAMMEIDERTAQLPELEQAMKRAKDALAQFEKPHQTRLSNLPEQLGQAFQEVKAGGPTLPDHLPPAHARPMAPSRAPAIPPAPPP